MMVSGVRKTVVPRARPSARVLPPKPLKAAQGGASSPEDSAAAPQGRKAAIDGIRRQLQRSSESGVPKYINLRRAIAAVIEEGALAPGDQLPPEEMLTSALSLSLGTVRRALAHLAAGGFVTREHGRGTFVAGPLRAIDDSWHFRFAVEGSDTLLPTYSHVLSRAVIGTAGPWADRLGDDAKGYVRIVRCFNIDGRLLTYSEFYLRASRFGGILELPLEALESVNLKLVLAERFAAPTLSVTQRLRVETFPEEVCELLEMERRANGLFLEIVANSFDERPISYQRIYVPPTDLLMDLSPRRAEISALAKAG